MSSPLIPVGVHRRWQLAMQGYTYDVAAGVWRRGRVALTDEAIDGPDEDLWALLTGRWENSAPEEALMNAQRRYETWRSSTLRYERLAAAVPLTADSVDLYAGTVKGIASVFGSPVKTMMGLSKVMPGAFAKTLAAHPDLSYFKFFREHHTPVGVLTEATEAFDGLRIRAKLSNTSLGRDTLIDIKNGTLGALSIGFDPTRVRYETEPNGDQVRFIEELDLFEVSACPWGADTQAHVEEAYSRHHGLSHARQLAEAELALAEALTAAWPKTAPGPQRAPWESEEMLRQAERHYTHALVRQGHYTPSPRQELAAYLRQQAALGRPVAGGLVPTSVEERGYLAPLMSQRWLQAQATEQRREQQLYEAGCAMSLASTRQTGHWHVAAWNHH